jgi:hypothetical protein
LKRCSPRIDADGAEAELRGGAKDANGDLAAVGREKFLNRFGFLHSGSDQSATRKLTLFHVRGVAQQQFISIRGKNKIHVRAALGGWHRNESGDAFSLVRVSPS